MKSMTGFGRGEASGKGYQVSVDISSVNRKQLDIRFATPKEALFLEAMVRSTVPEFIARGTVNIQMKINNTSGSSNSIKFNDELIKNYLEHIEQLQKDTGLSGELSMTDILSLPGAVEQADNVISVDDLTEVATESLKMALTNLIEARTIEGSHLKEDLITRKDILLKYVKDLSEKSSSSVAQFREKLHSRISEAGLDLDLDSDRIHQEVVMYADRTDITEELVRLDGHLQQLGKLIEKKEPVGRELDFLMQELNREINTTSSKSSDSDIARLAVAIKAELERCREQIQNVE
ncbi:MAG: YicC family protein [Lentisphaeraceae bacterium]|nr:YicC family protein [Lentisphaeraceae bacterium]